jgi:hypothetical protein
VSLNTIKNEGGYQRLVPMFIYFIGVPQEEKLVRNLEDLTNLVQIKKVKDFTKVPNLNIFNSFNICFYKQVLGELFLF